MVVDEKARHELYAQLERTLGPEATETLMTLLPPVGWADVATRQDLDALGHRLDRDMADLRTEMADLRTDLRTEMADLRTELHTEIGGLRTELHTGIGGLRADLATSQRHLLFAMLGAMFTLAGLAWGAITLT